MRGVRAWLLLAVAEGRVVLLGWLGVRRLSGADSVLVEWLWLSIFGLPNWFEWRTFIDMLKIIMRAWSY